MAPPLVAKQYALRAKKTKSALHSLVNAQEMFKYKVYQNTKSPYLAHLARKQVKAQQCSPQLTLLKV